MNLYELLGVEQTASVVEIRKAYLALAQQHHPDKLKGKMDMVKANEKFVEISLAYQTLSDPDKRKRYDSQLRKEALNKEREMVHLKATLGLSDDKKDKSTPTVRKTQRSQDKNNKENESKKAGTKSIRIKKLDPNDITKQFHDEATQMLRQGNFDAAVHKLKWILKLNPNHLEAISNLSFIYAQMKTNLYEAKRLAILGIQLDPDNPVHYYNLGCIYEAAGQIQQAKREYRNALNIKANYLEAQKALDKLEKKNKK